MKSIRMRQILSALICLLLFGLFLPGIGTARAAVTPVAVQLSQRAVTIDMASQKTFALTAVVQPADANQRVTWSTSNSRVARVNSSGVITAVSRGTATITAKARNSSTVLATCTVTVKNSSLPDGISLGLTAISMERFSTRQLTPTVWPDSANKAVKWKTSNRSVASVSQDGLITANKAGTAVITCYSAKDKSIEARVQVTVFAKSAPSSISLSPAGDVLSVGETLKLTAGAREFTYLAGLSALRVRPL